MKASDPDPKELARQIGATSETYWDQINEAFKHDRGPEFVLPAIDALRENMRDAHNGLRRAFVSSLLLAAAFVLIAGARVTELDLGPFKLTDASLVEKALPVGVAFMAYKINLNLRRIGSYHNLLEAVMHTAAPQLVYINFARVLRPPSPSLASGLFEQGRRSGPTLAMTIEAFAIIFGSSAFTIYAYVEVFRDFGVFDVLALISAAVSAYWLIRASRVTQMLDQDVWSTLEKPSPDESNPEEAPLNHTR